MVDVAPVRTKPMPVLLESVGQVVSEHTVQVRPQVSGMLRRVYFSEGQEVAAGQRLFQIEAAPFEAALTATRAAWQSARGNAARLVQLEKQHYVTPPYAHRSPDALAPSPSRPGTSWGPRTPHRS